MTIQEFKNTLAHHQPPSGMSPFLLSLWWDGKGDWHQAHGVAQDILSEDGSWVHAYLHRREGDSGNAAYWYHRAGKAIPSKSLEEEWVDLVHHGLNEKNEPKP
jgi:hypothetical protein